MPTHDDDKNCPDSPAVVDKFDREGFVQAFGNCFRGGAILAQRAFDGAPSAANDAAGVFRALQAQFHAATAAEKRDMLKAYTPLDPGIRAARVVGDEGQSDGLRAMTAAQQGRLLDLLGAYLKRFGFDAIFVVGDYTTAQLLAALEVRVVADADAELSTTYSEVERLALIQVEAYFAARPSRIVSP